EPERDARPPPRVDARRRDDRSRGRQSRQGLPHRLKTTEAAADASFGAAMDLNALLKNVVDSGATDLHLKLALPPVVRRDGELGAPEGWQPLSEADLETIVVAVTERTPHRLEGFRERGELDPSYMAPAAARF